MSSQGYYSADLHAVKVSSQDHPRHHVDHALGFQSHLPSFSAFPAKAFPSTWNLDLITNILITLAILMLMTNTEKDDDNNPWLLP